MSENKTKGGIILPFGKSPPNRRQSRHGMRAAASAPMVGYPQMDAVLGQIASTFPGQRPFTEVAVRDEIDVRRWRWWPLAKVRLWSTVIEFTTMGAPADPWPGYKRSRHFKRLWLGLDSRRWIHLSGTGLECTCKARGDATAIIHMYHCCEFDCPPEHQEAQAVRSKALAAGKEPPPWEASKLAPRRK